MMARRRGRQVMQGLQANTAKEKATIVVNSRQEGAGRVPHAAAADSTLQLVLQNATMSRLVRWSEVPGVVSDDEKQEGGHRPHCFQDQ
jgi:hypothetical protein